MARFRFGAAPRMLAQYYRGDNAKAAAAVFCRRFGHLLPAKQRTAPTDRLTSLGPCAFQRRKYLQIVLPSIVPKIYVHASNFVGQSATEEGMFSYTLSRTALVAAITLMPGLAFADDVQDQAQKAADRWDQAYNGGDIESLGKLYTADAVVVTKGKPQSGEDIPKFFSGMKSKGWDEHRTSVKSAQPKGELIIVTGRWEMTGPGEGGAKKKFEGNWVNVMEKKGGDLRTVLHTWN